jgi:hypothetical protein
MREEDKEENIDIRATYKQIGFTRQAREVE